MSEYHELFLLSSIVVYKEEEEKSKRIKGIPRDACNRKYIYNSTFHCLNTNEGNKVGLFCFYTYLPVVYIGFSLVCHRKRKMASGLCFFPKGIISITEFVI